MDIYTDWIHIFNLNLQKARRTSFFVLYLDFVQRRLSKNCICQSWRLTGFLVVPVSDVQSSWTPPNPAVEERKALRSSPVHLELTAGGGGGGCFCCDNSVPKLPGISHRRLSTEVLEIFPGHQSWRGGGGAGHDQCLFRDIVIWVLLFQII